MSPEKHRTTAGPIVLFILTILICLLFALARSGQTARGPAAKQAAEKIVQQIDHILLVMPDDGRALVSTLSDRLLLPIIWPQPGADWKASTGIGMGDVTLEIFHRDPQPEGQPPRVPRISSLALQPTDLRTALEEMRSRGIAHSPPPEPLAVAAGTPPPRWTTVGLERFGHGLFLIQYIFDMDERRARFDRVLRERGGGPLGILRVSEVVIAPAGIDEVRERWTKLLGPSDNRETYLWTVGDGPKIRLVKTDDPRANTLVIEIKSLDVAAKALRRMKITASKAKRQIRIDPAGMSGLRLVLEEKR